MTQKKTVSVAFYPPCYADGCGMQFKRWLGGSPAQAQYDCGHALLTQTAQLFHVKAGTGF